MSGALAPREDRLPALVLTSADGPFGVVAGVLDTLHGLGLEGLIRLGEFFDALHVSLRNGRKPLIIT